jgi:hypothetical protein
LILFTQTVYSQPEILEPIKVVTALLDGWREADFEKASNTLHADFRLVSMHHEEQDLILGKNTRDELLVKV